MTKNKLHRNQFQNYFRDEEAFEVADIEAFYRQFEPSIKRGTLDWRIHELVNQTVIYRIGRGKYTLREVREFTAPVSLRLKQLFGQLSNEFPYTKMCIWTTTWLHDWMLHLPAAHFLLVETEKGAEESRFYFLKEIRKNVFLQPSANLLEKYARYDKEIIIVKTLISQSPLVKKGKIVVPHLEKILVDLVADEELFQAFQGRDLLEIYSNSQRLYAVNEGRLLRYAQRRGRRETVLSLLNETK